MNVLFDCQIRCLERGDTSERTNGIDCSPGAVCCDVAYDHLRTGLRKEQGRLAADATCGAGYYDRFAFKVLCHGRGRCFFFLSHALTSFSLLYFG
ncbi:hypothetical protein D3C80_1662410 [compost metagenome]